MSDTFYIRDKWCEEYNGIRGYWKTYYFRNPYGHAKVFEALAAGECPHDSYEIGSVQVSHRYQNNDGSYRSQLITVYTRCDDCETCGEITMVMDKKTLKDSYNYIMWDAERATIPLELPAEFVWARMQGEV